MARIRPDRKNKIIINQLPLTESTQYAIIYSNTATKHSVPL